MHTERFNNTHHRNETKWTKCFTMWNKRRDSLFFFFTFFNCISHSEGVNTLCAWELLVIWLFQIVLHPTGRIYTIFVHFIKKISLLMSFKIMNNFSNFSISLDFESIDVLMKKRRNYQKVYWNDIFIQFTHIHKYGISKNWISISDQCYQRPLCHHL